MKTEQLNSTFSIYLGVEDLRLFLNPAWSSQHDGHRQMLRRAIDDWFEKQNEGSSRCSRSVMNLAELPEAEGHSLSISHCKRAGGFVVARICHSVGFDIEINQRLEGVRLRLVSFDEEELKESPTPAAFWTGKEAAYKCLRGPSQPRGLKDIRIGRWKLVAPNVHRFEVIEVDRKRTDDIIGLVIDDGEMSYAVCIRKGREENKPGEGPGEERCAGY